MKVRFNFTYLNKPVKIAIPTERSDEDLYTPAIKEKLNGQIVHVIGLTHYKGKLYLLTDIEQENTGWSYPFLPEWLEPQGWSYDH